MSFLSTGTDMAQAEACMINRLIMSCVEEKYNSNKNKILISLKKIKI